MEDRLLMYTGFSKKEFVNFYICLIIKIVSIECCTTELNVYPQYV